MFHTTYGAALLSHFTEKMTFIMHIPSSGAENYSVFFFLKKKSN